MTPTVRFTADPSRKLLRVKMTGFFMLDAVADYIEQRRAAFNKLGCGPGEHITLCDVRGCHISTQEVLSAFAAALADPATRARRIAFITDSALLRQQIRRMVDADRARCFGDEVEALAWLADAPAETSRATSPVRERPA